MSLNQRKTLAFVLGDISAGTDRTIYAYRAQRSEKIRAAWLTVSTTVAKTSTDYVTVTVKKGTTSIAELATSGSSGNALTAAVSASMTITEANAVLAAGDQVNIVVAHTGSSGKALDEPVVQLDIDPIE